MTANGVLWKAPVVPTRCDLTALKSADAPMLVVTLLLLLPGVGSLAPTAVMLLLFTGEPVVVAVACTKTVHTPAFGNTVTVPFKVLPVKLLLQVAPAVPVLLTTLKPVKFAGIASVKVLLLAADGPALL